MSINPLEKLISGAEQALVRGSLVEAEQLALTVLAQNPHIERALLVLGAVNEERGNFPIAGCHFEKAIILSPDWWLAYLSKSSYESRTQRADAGIKLVQRVYRIAPVSIESYCAAAALFGSTGNQSLCRDALHRALCCAPEVEQSWRMLGELDEKRSVVLTERVVTVSPESVSNRIDLGNILLNSHSDKALLQYQIAAALEPSNPKAAYNIGLTLFQKSLAGKADAFFARAAQVDPEFADAHYNHANVAAARNAPEQALSLVEKALALVPADSRFLTNRGNALFETRRLELAIRQFVRSLVVKPSVAETYGNLGVAYQEVEQHERSLSMHDAALCLRPDWVDGYWNKAIALLMAGHWERGWNLYEWRWQRDTDPSLFKRNFSSPVWLGRHSLQGKTLLLHTEQGLGDSLQMARFIRSIDTTDTRLIVEAEKPLLRLFATLSPDIRVIKRGDQLPSFDLHCPFMSLPLALRITPEDIPNPPPYFAIPESTLIDWEQRLGRKKRPRIGVMWQGGSNIKLSGRSIDLELLASILDDRFEWVSLQKDVSVNDQEFMRQIKLLRHFGAEQQDFLDAAAICMLCDLVITIDTSVAHLAGALGRPTWILLQKHADWRWFRHRSDSPWYPSVRLYRQNESGNWKEVLSTISNELVNHPFA